MSWVSWTVFVAFIAWVVVDGVRRTRGAKNLDDYYAGGRKIPWWAAGLSIMATQASAITVIGTTGQGHEGGLSFLQTYLGLPFAMIVLSIFLIPLLRGQPILTAYEYLERRFDAPTRSLASLIFLVSRCAALGLVIYAPSLVMAEVLGIDITVAIAIIGALTTLYTVFGGVSAVVWTDVKQMTVILAGLAIVFGVLVWEIGKHMGFGDALRVVGAAGKLDALIVEPQSLDFVPRTLESFEAGEGGPSFWEKKYNLWSGLFGGMFLMMAYFGCDQSQAQRILTNPTANDSRRALLVSAFAKVPMQFGVLLIGVLMWLSHGLESSPMLHRASDVAYASQPANAAAYEKLQQEYEGATSRRRELMLEVAATEGEIPKPLLIEYQQSVAQASAIRSRAVSAFQEDRKSDRNYIFPAFILRELHPILVGLILAAIFAAAMSSVDSVLNSLSAATVVDFYKRWLRPAASEREGLMAGRGMTLFWGLAASITAAQLGGGGSLIEQINKVGSFFYGTLLGAFALALLVPRAGGLAAFVGMLAGMTTVLVVWDKLKVEFLWFNVIGCVAVVLVGWLVSLVAPRRPGALPAT